MKKLATLLAFLHLQGLFGVGFIYVCDVGSNQVSIVDATTNTAIGYINNNGFDTTHPVHILSNPAGTKFYLTCDLANAVYVIDPLQSKITHQVDSSIYPFDGPQSASFTLDGLKCYVTNTSGNSVSVIDVTTDTVIGYVNPNGFPFNVPTELDVSSTEQEVYICNFSGNNVSVVDILTDTVTEYVDPNGFPFNNPSEIVILNGVAYITNANGNNISILDTATDKIIGYVNDAGFPFSIPFGIDHSNDGPPPTTVLVTNLSSNKVSVIDVATNTVTQYIDDTLGPFSIPYGLHISGDNLKALISNLGNDTVSVVDMSNLSFVFVSGIVNSIDYPFSQPADIEFSPLIIPSSQPPRNLRAQKTQNMFASQIDLINVITWDAPLDPTPPNAYNIYRDANLTDLAATVGGLIFEDHNRKKQGVSNYYIVSLDPNKSPSAPAFISVSR